jgi:preprotein translocase subunit SecY
VVIIAVLTAGTAVIMWLGEQINQKGIGNGISILLFAGIVARLPDTVNILVKALGAAWESPDSFGQYYFFVPLFVIIFLAIIWVIVFMNDAERRIPVQYAKRVVGRKMYGGQSTHLPIKVNMSGVMPIIFASSILTIPSTIQLFVTPTGFWKTVLDALSTTGWVYALIYFLLILMFAYFYVAIQYNPIEMANNLRQNNGTIPGIRPGKPTSDYIQKILSKITLIGALFLAVIALLPIAFSAFTGMHNLMMGGTSVIILVGVALDTMKQMESQMMMRHYKGFLD